MVGLIWAQTSAGVIGNAGAIPWSLPEDLAHFKATTVGGPVIMGRKTWDSLPPRFRPLPGRRNIVVTRQTGWHGAGAERVGTLENAIELAGTDAWVIGGAEIYRAAMPFAQILVVTEIDADLAGDAFAPTIGPAWIASHGPWQVAADGLRYRFSTYRQIDGDGRSYSKGKTFPPAQGEASWTRNR
ncbi:dihydrofolate reductase [Skermania sp. ID1734]|nr:dihydrofolate reductase [Skermania sp. ID1734]